jgi:hypothetical protein
MCLICSSSFAIKPCNGLAGYKLGEKFSIENAKCIGEESNLNLYNATIIKPFMDFTHCFVGVTPNTNIIGSIILTQDIKSNGEKTFDKVKTVVESHYEIGENNKEKPLSFVGKEIKYIFPNNRFMGLSWTIKLLENDRITLIIVDETITKKGQDEFNQNTIKNTNTSGLE